jgi:hypothetical protein
MSVKKVRYDGKVYTYPREYDKEYSQRTAKQKANRTKRAQARAKMEKKYGKSALKGKDVDHKKGIGGGNGYSNLRIQSPSVNRARKSKSWK